MTDTFGPTKPRICWVHCSERAPVFITQYRSDCCVKYCYEVIELTPAVRAALEEKGLLS